MTTEEIQKVKSFAQRACYFQEEGSGDMLRMQWCSEIDFCCLDEDSGEEYMVAYEEVNLKTETFYELKPILAD